MNCRSALGLLTILVLLAFPTSHARASVSIELSVVQLAAKATTVVVGKPVETYSVWEPTDDGGQRILTYHRLKIDRTIAGNATSGEAWVRTMGGVVGSTAQHVEGEALLEETKPILLFLSERVDGYHVVTGMAQGMFRLTRHVDGTERLNYTHAMGKLLRPRQLRRPAAELHGRTIEEATSIILEARKNHGN